MEVGRGDGYTTVLRYRELKGVRRLVYMCEGESKRGESKRGEKALAYEIFSGSDIHFQLVLLVWSCI